MLYYWCCAANNIIDLSMDLFKNIVFFLLYILFRPRLIPLLLKDIYLPVYVQYEWLKKYPIGTIIDIGANRGNVSTALALLFPNADIFAFEPIDKEYAILKKRVRRFLNVTPVNVALSNKNGKVPFFINLHSPSSSMLPFSRLGKKEMPLVTISKKTFVNSQTLDSFFQGKKMKLPIFMKIDVQGAEKIVLNGGKKLLRKTSVIHIETGFENIYEKQCLFGDIYRLLTGFGFTYHGSIVDGHFFPLLKTQLFENSIFIKTNK